MRVNIEVTAGPAKGRVFNIDQADLFIVGRAKDSKVSLPNDPYLSRQHFVLEIAPPNCKITDLGSKNGTFVNGVRYGGRKPDPKIKQAPEGALSVTITAGEIVVGDTRLRISVSDSEGTMTRTRNGASVVTSSQVTVVRPSASESKNGDMPPAEVDRSAVTPGGRSAKSSGRMHAVTGNAAPLQGHASPIPEHRSPVPDNGSPIPGTPSAADSSLGFLIPRSHEKSLQARPVPAPVANRSALHVNAPPGQASPDASQATRLEGTPEGAQTTYEAPPDAGNSRADTMPELPEGERTTYEAPPPMLPGDQTVLEGKPPGVDPDGTILEHLDAVPRGAAPVHLDDKIVCTTCGKNVTKEVGMRARIPGAEYVCHHCRANRAFAARDRIARKARTGSTEPRPGSSAALAMLKEHNIVYPGYDVVDVLGTGGMGVVYKAIRKRDKLIVAIKSLLPNVPVSFENYRIFHREIEVTSRLKHPNIVEVLDHGNVRGAYYCVLEYVDGLSLKDYVHEVGGKLTLKQAAPLMMDTLAGLAAAHTANIETRAAGPKMMSGIVHRDLKPENILLKRDAFGWIPKIADFGIAKGFESAGMTDMTIAGVCGTPTYWPREQLTHYRYLHPATDVFSIAAVFYEILSGKCARPGMQETIVKCNKRAVSPELADFMRVIGSNPIPPIADVVPGIPNPVAAVIDKALLEIEVPLDEVEMRETLQRLRYPHAGAFREALSAAFKYSGL